MKFEDALVQMCLGKKIRHPSMDEDVWFQGCRVSIMGQPADESLPLSITKMKGDRQHPDMYPTWKETSNPCKHGNLPQLELFLVMSDQWIVFE